MSRSQTGGDHYSRLAIEPIDYIEGNKLGYSEGNVVKYISRHKNKNGLEDIQKCVDYCCIIAEKEYGASLNVPSIGTTSTTEDAIDAYQELYAMMARLVEHSYSDARIQQDVMYSFNKLVSDYVQAELGVPR